MYNIWHILTLKGAKGDKGFWRVFWCSPLPSPFKNPSITLKGAHHPWCTLPETATATKSLLSLQQPLMKHVDELYGANNMMLSPRLPSIGVFWTSPSSSSNFGETLHGTHRYFALTVALLIPSDSISRLKAPCHSLRYVVIQTSCQGAADSSDRSFIDRKSVV